MTAEAPSPQGAGRLPQPLEIDKFWRDRARRAVVTRLTEYEGHLLVDIRTFFTADDGTMRPAKGFACNVRLLPRLATRDRKGDHRGPALRLSARGRGQHHDRPTRHVRHTGRGGTKERAFTRPLGPVAGCLRGGLQRRRRGDRCWQRGCTRHRWAAKACGHFRGWVSRATLDFSAAITRQIGAPTTPIVIRRGQHGAAPCRFFSCPVRN